MKQLLPGFCQWSWFSEEKQLDFNGSFFVVGEAEVLVEPPPLAGEDQAFVSCNGPVDYIIVKNRDHASESGPCQVTFNCQLQVPEADASQMELKPTKTFKDQELLPG